MILGFKSFTLVSPSVSPCNRFFLRLNFLAVQGVTGKVEGEAKKDVAAMRRLVQSVPVAGNHAGEETKGKPMTPAEENQTPNDAKLFAWLAEQEAALDASRKADREAAIAVAGPIPAGWAYAKALRNPWALTRQQRRLGVSVPVSGWIAERPATRQWLFGVREGVEQLRSGSSDIAFVESFSSQEANRKRIEAEIEVSKKEITRRFDNSIAEWVADFETAFLADGRPFARRGLTGADGWLPWQLLDCR